MTSQDEQDVLYMLTVVVRSLVDHPDQVTVEPVVDDTGITYRVRVSLHDLGKLIGVNGRTARALRILLSANAARLKHNFMLDLSADTVLGTRVDGSRSLPV